MAKSTVDQFAAEVKEQFYKALSTDVNDLVVTSWSFVFDGTPLNLTNDIDKAEIPDEVKTFILSKNVGKRISVHCHGDIPPLESSESSGPMVPVQTISITLKTY